jgi:hypothetical protein
MRRRMSYEAQEEGEGMVALAEELSVDTVEGVTRSPERH